ncbi:MAG TPA: hypothetical protein VF821_20775 [Lentzea sp.]
MKTPKAVRSERSVDGQTFTLFHRPWNLPQARWQATLDGVAEYSVSEESAIARLIIFLGTGQHAWHNVTIAQALEQTKGVC